MTSSAEQQQSKQIVRLLFEASNQQDIEKIAQLVSINSYSFYFSGNPPMDWNGHIQLFTAFNNAFSDLHRNIEDMVAEGGKVAVRFTITGTHTGELQGIPPSGKKISFDAMDFLTILDGKITEEWVTADMMGLMQQIGAVPGESH
jgi:steroid delta-isomerase-like uncharacterized protein